MLLVARLKVVADKLTEIELVATRPCGRPHLRHRWPQLAGAVMNYAPRLEQHATRDGRSSGAALRGRAQCRQDLRRRERTLRARAYRYENGG